MADVLFIKTSSLGDVIHHMPAVTEAKARRPGDRFVWAVEPAFAPLVRLHPGVDEVIPVGLRRWRGTVLLQPAVWAEIAALRRTLGARRYDAIVDTQGLIKSALVARAAQGVRHGYDAQSIREPLAARVYDVRHRVERDRHAVERNRLLTALALGYQPHGAPDYGLPRGRPAATGEPAYAVFLHGTAQARKQWPLANWQALAAELSGRYAPVLPWGDVQERERAERIAQGVANARVPDLRPLDEVAGLIAGASLVVGVDTGLLHLAAALGVPLVAIFTGSEPALTGPVGPGPIEVLGHRDAPPDVPAVLQAIARVTGRTAARD
jgi:heptosyltransferase-1